MRMHVVHDGMYAWVRRRGPHCKDQQCACVWKHKGYLLPAALHSLRTALEKASLSSDVNRSAM